MKAASPAPSPISSTFSDFDNESEFLEKWSLEIDRAVRHRAWASKWSFWDVEDFTQEVRIRLLTVHRARRRMPENYVRIVIKNAISNAIRDEARKIPLSSPRVFSLSHDIQKTQEILDSTSDRDCLEMLIQRKALVTWIGTLPLRLQAVYELLYQRGFSQFEAARALEISQPRVVQLHRRFLAAAKQEWG